MLLALEVPSSSSHLDKRKVFLKLSLIPATEPGTLGLSFQNTCHVKTREKHQGKPTHISARLDTQPSP